MKSVKNKVWETPSYRNINVKQQTIVYNNFLLINRIFDLLWRYVNNKIWIKMRDKI